MKKAQTLNVVTKGMDEAKAYYVDGRLVETYDDRDGIHELEMGMAKLIIQQNVRNVEFYYLTQEGLEKYEESDGVFPDDFEEYNMVDLQFKNRVLNK